MENSGFIITIWVIWIITVVIQLVATVKFFSMTSDIKAMKDMMQQFMKTEQAKSGIIPAEDNQLPKDELKKFRWQKWMYIAIAVILLLLFFLN